MVERIKSYTTPQLAERLGPKRKKKKVTRKKKKTVRIPNGQQSLVGNQSNDLANILRVEKQRHLLAQQQAKQEQKFAKHEAQEQRKIVKQISTIETNARLKEQKYYSDMLLKYENVTRAEEVKGQKILEKEIKLMRAEEAAEKKQVEHEHNEKMKELKERSAIEKKEQDRMMDEPAGAAETALVRALVPEAPPLHPAFVEQTKAATASKKKKERKKAEPAKMEIIAPAPPPEPEQLRPHKTPPATPPPRNMSITPPITPKPKKNHKRSQSVSDTNMILPVAPPLGVTDHEQEQSIAIQKAYNMLASLRKGKDMNGKKFKSYDAFKDHLRQIDSIVGPSAYDAPTREVVIELEHKLNPAPPPTATIHAPVARRSSTPHMQMEPTEEEEHKHDEHKTPPPAAIDIHIAPDNSIDVYKPLDKEHQDGIPVAPPLSISRPSTADAELSQLMNSHWQPAAIIPPTRPLSRLDPTAIAELRARRAMMGEEDEEDEQDRKDAAERAQLVKEARAMIAQQPVIKKPNRNALNNDIARPESRNRLRHVDREPTRPSGIDNNSHSLGNILRTITIPSTAVVTKPKKKILGKRSPVPEPISDDEFQDEDKPFKKIQKGSHGQGIKKFRQHHRHHIDYFTSNHPNRPAVF